MLLVIGLCCSSFLVFGVVCVLVIFFSFFCVMCPKLSLSLDCPFLITPSAWSKIYFNCDEEKIEDTIIVLVIN